MQSAGWDWNGHEFDDATWFLVGWPICRWCETGAEFWQAVNCFKGDFDSLNRWTDYSNRLKSMERQADTEYAEKIDRIVSGAKMAYERRLSEEREKLWQNPGL